MDESKKQESEPEMHPQEALGWEVTEEEIGRALKKLQEGWEF